MQMMLKNGCGYTNSIIEVKEYKENEYKMVSDGQQFYEIEIDSYLYCYKRNCMFVMFALKITYPIQIDIKLLIVISRIYY